MTPNQRLEQLALELRERFAPEGCELVQQYAELTLVVPAERWLSLATVLRDDASFGFDQLVDVCGLDYAAYGNSDWITQEASSSGFGRGQQPAGKLDLEGERRFAAVYHLLSMTHNNRLRVKVYLNAAEPIIDSVVSIWAVADWFEREAFDMFGILFSGHPDLRRILTDYGFIGHPMRKDFPLSGNVEMRYDEETKRVIYQPLSIPSRPQVPKVIRQQEPLFGDASNA